MTLQPAISPDWQCPETLKSSNHQRAKLVNDSCLPDTKSHLSWKKTQWSKYSHANMRTYAWIPKIHLKARCCHVYMYWNTSMGRREVETGECPPVHGPDNLEYAAASEKRLWLNQGWSWGPTPKDVSWPLRVHTWLMCPCALAHTHILRGRDRQRE